MMRRLVSRERGIVSRRYVAGRRQNRVFKRQVAVGIHQVGTPILEDFHLRNIYGHLRNIYGHLRNICGAVVMALAFG